MKDTFRGVAESAKKNGGKIDQGTKDAIQGWMNTMNSTLVQALIDEANDYQAILNAAWDNVEGCASSRVATFADETSGVKGHAISRDDARKAHLDSKNCGTKCADVVEGHPSLLQQWPTGHNHSYDTSRHWGKEDEAADYSAGSTTHVEELAKTTCETLAYNDQSTKCATLDIHVKSLAPTPPKDWCTDASATTHENRPVAHPHTTAISQRQWNSWEARDTSNDVVYTWFHAMDQWDVTHVDTYKAERVACHDARRAHQHRTQKTYQLQRAFESAFCAWTNSIDVTCHVYDGCYESTKYTHGVQLALATTVETQLKAQQAALECVLCYGGQILLDNTDLSQCDNNAGCQNCDPLTIEKKVPHTKVACDEKQTEKPCTDAWKTKEYGCFAAETPANDCGPTEACPDAVLPSWPANATESGRL